MSRWRYIAIRAHTGEVLHWSLPLHGVTITRAISSPGRLTGTIPRGLLPHLAGDGLPYFDRWSTLIFADDGTQIRGGGILHTVETDETETSIDVAGFSAYPKGLPWAGPKWEGVQVDPLDVVRRCWADVQAAPGGGLLNVQVDKTATAVRVGDPGWWEDTETGLQVSAKRVKWTPKGPDSRWRYHEDNPVELSWWAVPDVGAMISRMVEAAGVDYLEETTMVGGRFVHRLRLGNELGTRRLNARLVVGENVTTLPTGVFDGDDIADTVEVRGAGEGAEMVRANANAPTHRLRRVAVVTDKAVTTAGEATSKARKLLPTYAGRLDFDTLNVREHPNASLSDLQPGDVVPLIANGDGYQFDGWVRVREVTYTPEAFTVATLKIAQEGA